MKLYRAVIFSVLLLAFILPTVSADYRCVSVYDGTHGWFTNGPRPLSPRATAVSREGIPYIVFADNSEQRICWFNGTYVNDTGNWSIQRFGGDSYNSLSRPLLFFNESVLSSLKFDYSQWNPDMWLYTTENNASDVEKEMFVKNWGLGTHMGFQAFDYDSTSEEYVAAGVSGDRVFYYISEYDDIERVQGSFPEVMCTSFGEYWIIYTVEGASDCTFRIVRFNPVSNVLSEPEVLYLNGDDTLPLRSSKPSIGSSGDDVPMYSVSEYGGVVYLLYIEPDTYNLRMAFYDSSTGLWSKHDTVISQGWNFNPVVDTSRTGWPYVGWLNVSDNSVYTGYLNESLESGVWNTSAVERSSSTEIDWRGVSLKTDENNAIHLFFANSTGIYYVYRYDPASGNSSLGTDPIHPAPEAHVWDPLLPVSYNTGFTTGPQNGRYINVHVNQTGYSGDLDWRLSYEAYPYLGDNTTGFPIGSQEITMDEDRAWTVYPCIWKENNPVPIDYTMAWVKIYLQAGREGSGWTTVANLTCYTSSNDPYFIPPRISFKREYNETEVISYMYNGDVDTVNGVEHYGLELFDINLEVLYEGEELVYREPYVSDVSFWTHGSLGGSLASLEGDWKCGMYTARLVAYPRLNATGPWIQPFWGWDSFSENPGLGYEYRRFYDRDAYFTIDTEYFYCGQDEFLDASLVVGPREDDRYKVSFNVTERNIEKLSRGYGETYLKVIDRETGEEVVLDEIVIDRDTHEYYVDLSYGSYIVQICAYIKEGGPYEETWGNTPYPREGPPPISPVKVPGAAEAVYEERPVSWFSNPDEMYVLASTYLFDKPDGLGGFLYDAFEGTGLGYSSSKWIIGLSSLIGMLVVFSVMGIVGVFGSGVILIIGVVVLAMGGWLPMWILMLIVLFAVAVILRYLFSGVTNE